MRCRLQGHSFVVVRSFDSDIHTYESDIETKIGTQTFHELMCQGCGGTVLEEKPDAWTPVEPKTE